METLKQSEGCIQVKKNFKSTGDDPIQFLLVSDVHFDNVHCNRSLLKRHFDEAVRRNAKILSFGDFFCAMQGRYDPRKSKADLRPEHKKANYLDTLVSTAVDWLQPYKDHLLLFSDGNHETSILTRMETDLTGRLVEGLNISGGMVYRGGYHGFIRFTTSMHGTNRRTVTLYYHHGKYGGQMTMGVLGVKRHAAVVPDADIIVTGHTHDKWFVELARYHVTASGNIQVRPQYHVKCATYKQEFEKVNGWAIQNIVNPKPLGSWFVTIYPHGKDGQVPIGFEKV